MDKMVETYFSSEKLLLQENQKPPTWQLLLFDPDEHCSSVALLLVPSRPSLILQNCSTGVQSKTGSVGHHFWFFGQSPHEYNCHFRHHFHCTSTKSMIGRLELDKNLLSGQIIVHHSWMNWWHQTPIWNWFQLEFGCIVHRSDI